MGAVGGLVVLVCVFGAYMAATIEAIDPAVRVGVHGVPDRFIEQAPRKVQLRWTGLDAEGIAARVRTLLASEAVAGPDRELRAPASTISSVIGVMLISHPRKACAASSARAGGGICARPETART